MMPTRSLALCLLSVQPSFMLQLPGFVLGVLTGLFTVSPNYAILCLEASIWDLDQSAGRSTTVITVWVQFIQRGIFARVVLL